MTKEVLKLALEALEASARNWPSDSVIEAITAIKEALMSLQDGEQTDQEPVATAMTAHRAAYFMERFKHEEKLLGPNEQAALDFVISMLEAQPEQAMQVTDEENEQFSRDVSNFKGADPEATKYALEAFLRNRALAKPEQEPLEYWNAVEGWVKLDEVREHFDSVGCGTIYKTAGEGREPLYTTPPQRTWVWLSEQERNDLEDYCEMIIGKAAFDAIEAKLRSKNGY